MNSDSPIEILVGETEQINPAILLAEEFMRRDAAEFLSTDDIKRAEEILRIGKMEIETIERHMSAFVRSPASPSLNIPTGF